MPWRRPEPRLREATRNQFLARLAAVFVVLVIPGTVFVLPGQPYGRPCQPVRAGGGLR